MNVSAGPLPTVATGVSGNKWNSFFKGGDMCRPIFQRVVP